MYIHELISKQAITIIAHINDEDIYHTTKITKVYEKKRLILAAPIFQDEKVLSFQAQGLKTDLLAYPENDKPQLFKDISITLMKNEEQSFCYLLKAPAESVPYNRRQYYRCHIRAKGKLRTVSSASVYDATLMDVSLHGFAFTCPRGPEFILGQELSIEMKDTLAEYGEELSFVLNGIVVRSYVQYNGGNVYGCRMDRRVPGLDVYIMKKERLRLKPENTNL